jgi:hypothetical protein
MKDSRNADELFCFETKQISYLACISFFLSFFCARTSSMYFTQWKMGIIKKFTSHLISLAIGILYFKK